MAPHWQLTIHSTYNQRISSSSGDIENNASSVSVRTNFRFGVDDLLWDSDKHFCRKFVAFALKSNAWRASGQ